MAPKSVFGPNDFNMAAGVLEPGLGDEEERVIREARGGGFVTPEDPPEKAALRKEHETLKAKAKQLSLVERELEKEKADAAASMQAREDALAEREALLEAQLADLAKK